MPEATPIREDSYFIPVNDTDTLHLKRFHGPDAKTAVFLVHGAIENGRIFWSKSGKGLAPWLAQQGYDVFVPDFRGKGLSTPRIGRHSTFGQQEVLKEDFPAFLAKIRELKGSIPPHWMAHSWGGTQIFSFLARNPGLLPQVKTLTLFASRRRFTIRSLKRLWDVEILWRYVTRFFIRRHGFLNAVKMKFGADNESKRGFLETDRWVQGPDWKDPEDGFDFQKILPTLDLPAVLSLTGTGDTLLGNAKDVQLLVEETGAKTHQFYHIGKATGYRHNYDHINILTHKEAPTDHFPLVVAHMEKYK